MRKALRVVWFGVAAAAVVLGTTEAQSFEVVGPGRGTQPDRGGVVHIPTHPGPGHGPGYGRGPGHPPPGPGRPNPPPGYDDGRRYPPPRSGYCGSITGLVRRIVFNERLPIRQLLALGRNYEGCAVESIQVNIPRGRRFDGRGHRDSASLLLNGFREDWRSIDWNGGVWLQVRGIKRLGFEIGRMELEILGRVPIESITVNMGRQW